MNEPNKIRLLIIPSWYPPDGGHFFREHAEALAAEGCIVDVLVNRMVGMSKFRLPDLRHLKRFHVSPGQGTREIRTFTLKIPFLNRKSINIWISRYVRHCEKYLARYGKPDLMIVHSVLWAGPVALKISQKHNIPYLVVEHRSRFILNSPEARSMVKSADLPVICKVLGGSVKIITVSENLRKGLLSLFPDLVQKTLTIPNMVDTEYFNYTSGSRSTDPFVFLYVGLLERVKGLDILVEAFRKVRESNRNVRLRIVGRGSVRRELELLVKELNLVASVSIPGYLDRNQLLEEYRRANAFVLASRFEAFGVVLIEAMSAGLPVVATRSGGPENIITEQCGILAERENADDLSRAMMHLIDHYEDYKAELIRDNIVKNYSRKVIAGRYLQVLADIFTT